MEHGERALVAAGSRTETVRARAVLFDMDGTLADTQRFVLDVQRQVMAGVLGRPVSGAEVRRGFGLSEPGAMRLICGARGDEAYEAYAARLEREHAVLCPAPVPGIAALLEELSVRGLPLGVISGRSRRTLEISLRFFGFDRYFSYIGGGDPEREVKDERAREAFRRFGLGPEEVAYVGDTVADVRFSHGVGMRVAAVSYASFDGREALRQAEPDFLCDSVARLRDVLLALL